MTAHTQQPQFIDHRYPNDVVARMIGKPLLVWGGDVLDTNSLAVGMNGESGLRFLIDSATWLHAIRRDTVKVAS